MTSPDLSWTIALGVLTSILLITCYSFGPARALGAAVAASFLFPVWVKWSAFGAPLDLRTTTALEGLLLFAILTGCRFFNHLTLLDVSIAIMVIINTISDSMHGQSIVKASLSAYGEWAVPYVAGRYAIRSREDLRFLIPILTAVGTLLGAAFIAELVSGVNVFEMLFGPRPVEDAHRDMSRFGWKRAYGPTRHPNYGGGLLVLFLPWAIALVPRTVRTIQPAAVAGLLVTGAGCLATLSRGTWLAAACTPLMAACFSSKKIFFAGLSCAVILAAIAISNRDDAFRVIHSLGGDGQPTKTIEVDGEEVSYSGTASHYQVIQLYGPSLFRVGAFGAGTVAVEKFPPNVPGAPSSARTLKLIPMVDNGYILLGLRFGWIGLVALILILSTTIYQFLALRHDQELRPFALAMAAMATVYCFTLLTVWMSYDFAFVYLWSVGISSALQCSLADRHHPRLHSAGRR